MSFLNKTTILLSNIQPGSETRSESVSEKLKKNYLLVGFNASLSKWIQDLPKMM